MKKCILPLLFLLISATAQADDRAAAGVTLKAGNSSTTASISEDDIALHLEIIQPKDCVRDGIFNVLRTFVMTPVGIYKHLAAQKEQDDIADSLYDNCAKSPACRSKTYSSAYRAAYDKDPSPEVISRFDNGRDLRTALHSLDNSRKIKNIDRIREILNNTQPGPAQDKLVEDVLPGWTARQHQAYEGLAAMLKEKLGPQLAGITKLPIKEAAAQLCSALASLLVLGPGAFAEGAAGELVGQRVMQQTFSPGGLVTFAKDPRVQNALQNSVSTDLRNANDTSSENSDSNH